MSLNVNVLIDESWSVLILKQKTTFRKQNVKWACNLNEIFLLKVHIFWPRRTLIKIVLLVLKVS